MAGDGIRISCLVIGDVVYAPYNPFTSLFMQDPLFIYSLYPLPHVGDEEKRRLDRVYYPRNYEQLVSTYDAIIFRDARVTHFIPRQFDNLRRAFEGGMASVAAHSLSWGDAWVPTILYDMSPISEYLARFSNSWRVSFRRDVEPVFLPFVDLGMERAQGWEYGIMTVRQEATVWADMLPMGREWLASWRLGGPGGGMQWVFADKFDVTWWASAPGSRDTNPYGLDFATNLLLYSLNRDLISDIHARREARRLLSTFQARKLLILATLDWAEKFGANVLALSEGLLQIEVEAEEAVERYLEQDYDSTVSFMDSMSIQVSEMTEEAVELKDRALFWVYVSEWLVVMGVLMSSGTVLWSLMVRRSRFKEVRTTRMTEL